METAWTTERRAANGTKKRMLVTKVGWGGKVEQMNGVLSSRLRYINGGKVARNGRRLIHVIWVSGTIDQTIRIASGLAAYLRHHRTARQYRFGQTVTGSR